MRKSISALLAGAMLLMATSAMALPALPTGYNWTGAPFWTYTDTTTPTANGNSQFELRFENAAYESDFGLFTVTGTASNPGSIASHFQIFAYNEEPTTAGTEKTVYFRNDGFISLDGTNFTSFDKVFGFYFGVHTGGLGDQGADYMYYTYNPFNDPASQAGISHIATAFNATSSQVRIYLDDQLVIGSAGSDRDFDDMEVRGNDLTPVPEPGTMLLFGIGMLGMAVYGKRRMNKQA